MKTQNQSIWSTNLAVGIMLAVVVLGLIAAQVAAHPQAWSKVLAAPFLDRTAAKVMVALATLIVLVGGMVVNFVPERRGTVFHACGALLVCTYAVGQTITLF